MFSSLILGKLIYWYVLSSHCFSSVPSGPPANFNATAITSTSIIASWELPPADDRNGIITGFKLFYKKKDSLGSQTIEPINNGSIRNKVVTGLDEYTEYEFQVLAYTSVGDGPKSSKKYERTNEDGKKFLTRMWSRQMHTHLLAMDKIVL